jgi:CheY-like chemotaxis protein
MPVTVLLVDDSKLARIVAARALAAVQPGWAKLEAANAEEALAATDGGAVDVALLDFNMPGRDGLELAGELRSRFPDMPIAVVTANLQDEVVERARQVKAAFVPKPVDEAGLRPFLEGAALKLRNRAG